MPLTVDESARFTTDRTWKQFEPANQRIWLTSQNFSWDPGLWTAVTASNGGVLSVCARRVERARVGSLSSGLHHAQHGKRRSVLHIQWFGDCSEKNFLMKARDQC